MRISELFFTSLAIVNLVCVHAVYHWPSPLIDQLEGLLYEGKQEGLPDRAVDFVAQLNGCVPESNNESIAADWIRFAYHDMATHNIDDGTGGLDASIQLELDRNAGGDMERAKFDFIDFPNKYISYSDMIAMGVVLATVECGGPVVSYRGGRVDAMFPGPFGVPTPDQNIDDFIETFRRQGFTQQEMIALVACGHTVGGVHNPDFPTLVPPGDIAFEDNIVLFDTTPQFDNVIVTQYLDDTTGDLLVIGANGDDTLSSDLRVFSSDGNVTMQSLASPQNFSATCAHLLGRMIDTVPSNVTLTDFINPLPVKVAGVQLAPGYDGNLVLNLTMRLLSNKPGRQIALHWADHSSTTCSSGACTATPINSTVITTPLVTALDLSPVKYTFSAPISAKTSISSFWFEIDGGIENNGGTGYVIDQDRVLFSPDRSAFILDGFEFVAAVKNDTVPTSIFVSTYQRVTATGVYLTSSVNMTLNRSIPSAAGYDFYSAKVTGADMTFDLFAEIDGVLYEEELRDTHWIAEP